MVAMCYRPSICDQCGPVGFAFFLLLSCILHGESFVDSFDEEAAVDGADPINYTVFGPNTAGRGVTSGFNTSPSNSAYVVVDFDIAGFGSILIHDSLAGPISLSNGLVTTQVRVSTNLSTLAGGGSALPMVAYQLIDDSATVVETAGANFFLPTTSFQPFSEPVADMIITEGGGDFLFDDTQVTRYGIVFKDRGDLGGSAVFYVDDFQGGPGEAPPVEEFNDVALLPVTALEIISETGVIYSLQATLNRTPPAVWKSTGFSRMGTGTNMLLFDPSGYSTQTYYRIVEQ